MAGDLGDEVAGSFLTNLPLLSGGFVSNGRISISRNEAIVSSGTGYFKVALHEIGHAMGLAAMRGFNGTSVMNQMGVYTSPSDPAIFRNKPDDVRGNVPLDVTTCDRNKALEYSTP